VNAFYVLPYPPSVNTAYRATSKGVIKSKAYRQYSDDCWRAVQNQKALGFDGPVKVSITLGRPDKRKRDLDNTLKAVLDFLTDFGIWEDDSQIHDLRVRWDAQTTGAAVEVSAL
jgi:crossover junction endodeoxyribonuclease RusA